MLHQSQKMKLSNHNSNDFLSMSQGQTPMDCVLSENKEQLPPIEANNKALVSVKSEGLETERKNIKNEDAIKSKSRK